MIYEYWYACIRGISSKKKKALRDILGSAKRIYNIEEIHLKALAILTPEETERLISARYFSPWVKTVHSYLSKEIKEQLAFIQSQNHTNPIDYWKDWYELLQNKNISFIPYFSPQYPQKLLRHADSPYALYVKGSLPSSDLPSVAIVGARTCTPYGESNALRFGEALGAAGIQVISGLARGVDSLSQRGCINQQGSSFAVLGCGVDICYPKGNIGLYADLQKQGGILSEHMIGIQPLANHFPARNRIISGLSDAVLVIEAAKKSGSLITADMALEQGVDVYALPGPVHSPKSVGCHELIRQGAGIVLSPEQFLEELQLALPSISLSSGNSLDTATPLLNLTSAEQTLYSALDYIPKSLDQLSKETNLLAREVVEAMIGLELAGLVTELSKGQYAKKDRAS